MAMVRDIPVDSARFELVAAAEPAEVQEWVELSDGSRRPSGNQARDPETNLPLWTVDCLVLDQVRAATVGVQVGASVMPEVRVLSPVKFDGLTVRVVRNKQGQISQYWSATGIAEPGKASKPVAA